MSPDAPRPTLGDARIPVEASLFHGLQQRRPHLTTAQATKRTMVATSHLIEELVAASPGPCVLLSGFQQGRNWAVERDRYLALAGAHDVIAVFAGKEPPATWEAHHVGVRLNTGDPLTQEWFVLAIGPDIAVTLCGLDADGRLPPDGPAPPPYDADRLFEIIWSFSPAVAHEALDLVTQAIRDAAPERIGELDAALARVDDLGPLSAELVARGADQLVAGLLDRYERAGRL